jgi:RND family efflux transporter MFP subunit
MIKKAKIMSIVSVASFMLACGGEVDTLESLVVKRKDIQAQLVELDSLIDLKDTTTSTVFNPLVVVKPILEEDYSHKIEVLGLVSSDQNIVLSAESNGKIISISVKEGQKVTKGQTIAVIDGQMLADNADELQTQLDYANYMLDKQEKLKEKGVGSEFRVMQAQNQVNSIKDKMKSLSTMKGKTVVRAPFSGVVEEIMPNRGEFVGAGAAIARIVNVDKVTVTAEVSEKLLGSLKEGKDGTVVNMKFDHSTVPVSSTIESIGKFIDPINRTVKIRMSIDDNELLLPNMSGVIKINDVAINNATIIPSTAILKNENNEDFIYLLNEEKEENTYSVMKTPINVLSSFQGTSAISASADLIGKKVVDQGAKGISVNDIVKLKLASNE